MALSLCAKVPRSLGGYRTVRRTLVQRASKAPLRKYDIVVVGGGVMGSSSAYFLASRIPDRAVCVIERDFTYTKASSMLSVASIRQQFSCPENVLMSQYSVQFVRDAHQHLCISGGDEDRVDVGFVEGGYLFLASEEGEEVMRQNHSLQRELGAHVELLNPVQLARKFPWLNTQGTALASFGYRNEGWFDPWILLSGFKRKAMSLGVDYVHGEVTSINVECDRVKSVQSSNDDGDTEVVSCDYLVNAGGPWAAELALLAGIGQPDHENQIMREKLPVEPRLRSVFVFKCPSGPANCPLVVDGSIYWRREGSGVFLAGLTPAKDVDKAADGKTLDVDHRLFDEVLWPALAERVTAFEELKVQSGWSGFYEYNTLDQNAIIGTHPVVTNYLFANGFSGHGIQMSPAVGRAVSEIILDGRSHSIDLTNFSFQRVLDNRPYGERLVV